MADRLSNPFPRYFTDLGTLLPGGQLNFFEVGPSTTKKDTFTDSGGLTANTNPVILSASGLSPAVFLDGDYRITLNDKDGIQIAEADNVSSGATGAFADFSSTITYQSGGSNIVTGSDGLYYISTSTDNLGNDPTTSPDDWEPFFVRNPNKNILIGGDFSTNPWQRLFDGDTTFTAIANSTYSADRFEYDKVGTAVHNIIKSTDSPTVAQAGVFTTHSAQLDVTTADASLAAGDFVTFSQKVEGYNWIPVAQRTFVLSFWVKATKTGIYCVSFRNSGNDRSFVAEYTVNASGVWERKVIKVTASPSAGTWDYTNGTGVRVSWCLGSGSTFQTSAGAWNTGNFIATSNQVNALDSNSNDFRLALCQMEQGDYETDFEVLNREEIFGRCLRYFHKMKNDDAGEATMGVGVCFSTTIADINMTFPVRMRGVPILTLSATTNFRIFVGGSTETLTNLTLGNASLFGALLIATTTGLVVGEAAVLGFINSASPFFMEYDGEL